MDNIYRLESANQDNQKQSNDESISLYQKYMYYSRIANRFCRFRNGGITITPIIAAQINHIYKNKKESISYMFSDANLEDVIYKSLKINNI